MIFRHRTTGLRLALRAAGRLALRRSSHFGSLQRMPGRRDIARDAVPSPMRLEPLERRVLLSAVTVADLAGTYDFFTEESRGIITVDATGNITGGSGINLEAGGPLTVSSGSVTVDGDGQVSANVSGTTASQPFTETLIGGVESDGELLALSYLDTDEDSPLLLVKRSGTYGAAALAGQWDLIGEDGYGVATFNASGAITGGTFDLDPDGPTAITGGSYTVNSDGTASATITFAGVGDRPLTISQAGGMNMAVAQSTQPGEQHPLLMVKRQPGLDTARLDGEWRLTGTNVAGNIILDADASSVSITGGSGVTDDGGPYNFTGGSINAASNGTFTGSFQLDAPAVSSSTLEGVVAIGYDMIATSVTNESGEQSVAILTRSDAADTLPTWASLDGMQLTVTGTGGDDTFQIGKVVAGAYELTFNGQTLAFDTGEANRVIFNGGAGHDSVTLSTDDGANTVRLNAKGESGVLFGAGYAFTVTGSESIAVNGQANDTAEFFDSAGNDRFQSFPARSIFTGPGFTNRVNGFGNITVTSRNGGADDFAEFWDTNGNDHVRHFPTFTDLRASGGNLNGLFRRANGFDRVNTYGTSGGNDDFVEWWDSSGDDVFNSFPTRANMVRISGGEGANSRFASGFDRYNAYAVNGGNDRTQLFDTNGNDHVRHFPNFTDIRTTGGNMDGLARRVDRFERVVVSGTSGGSNDFVEWWDSSGDDQFRSFPGFAEMIRNSGGEGAVNRSTSGFDRYNAYAVNGGNDFAEFWDTPGNDHVRNLPTFSDVVTTGGAFNGLSRFASNFEKLNNYAVNGGNDFVEFWDTAGNDRFNSRADASTLSVLTGPQAGHTRFASNFERVNSYAVNGGSDSAELIDTAGDDRFIAFQNFSTMTAPGFSRFISRYENINVIAQNGGFDFAELYDTTGDDTFQGMPTISQLTSSLGLSRTVRDFEKVNSYRTSGLGNDTATLFDSEDDDTFVGRSNFGRLFGDGFQLYASGYDPLTIDGSNGGTNTKDVQGISYTLQEVGTLFLDALSLPLAEAPTFPDVAMPNTLAYLRQSVAFHDASATPLAISSDRFTVDGDSVLLSLLAIPDPEQDVSAVLPPVIRDASGSAVRAEWEAFDAGSGISYTVAAVPLADYQLLLQPRQADIEGLATVELGLVGDVDGDRDVDAADLAALQSAIGSDPSDQPAADVNLDGVIDTVDLDMAMRNVGASTSLDPLAIDLSVMGSTPIGPDMVGVATNHAMLSAQTGPETDYEVYRNDGEGTVLLDAATVGGDGIFTSLVPLNQAETSLLVLARDGFGQVMARRLDVQYNETHTWQPSPREFSLGDTDELSIRVIGSDEQGHVLVAGIHTGAVDLDPGDGEALLPELDATDRAAFLAKYTPAGRLLWSRSFLSWFEQDVTAITVDARGNIVLGGWFSGIPEIDADRPGVFLEGELLREAFIMKFNPSGDLLWANSIGSRGNDRVTGLTVDDLGNLDVTLATEVYPPRGYDLRVNPADAGRLVMRQPSSEGFSSPGIVLAQGLQPGEMTVQLDANGNTLAPVADVTGPIAPQVTAELMHATDLATLAPNQQDGMGRSLALDGNTLVTTAGERLFVFQRSDEGWHRTQTLTPLPGYDLRSVDVTDDLMVTLGSGGNEGLPEPPMMLYEHRSDGSWSLVQELVSSDPDFDTWGHDVALAGRDVIAGAWAGSGDPFAALFTADDQGHYAESQRLHIDSAVRGAYQTTFRIEANDNTLIIASVMPPEDSDNFGEPFYSVGPNSQAAHIGSPGIYQRDGVGGWFLQQHVPSPFDFDESFGWAISLSDNQLAIGNGLDRVHTYAPDDFGIWLEEQVLTAPEDSGFGERVSIAGDRLAIVSRQSGPYFDQGPLLALYGMGSQGWEQLRSELLASYSLFNNEVLLPSGGLTVDGDEVYIGLPDAGYESDHDRAGTVLGLDFTGYVPNQLFPSLVRDFARPIEADRPDAGTLRVAHRDLVTEQQDTLFDLSGAFASAHPPAVFQGESGFVLLGLATDAFDADPGASQSLVEPGHRGSWFVASYDDAGTLRWATRLDSLAVDHRPAVSQAYDQLLLTGEHADGSGSTTLAFNTLSGALEPAPVARNHTVGQTSHGLANQAFLWSALSPSTSTPDSSVGLSQTVYGPQEPILLVTSAGGVIPNGSPTATANQNTHFGNALVGAGSVTHTFYLENPGFTPLRLDPVEPVIITGEHAGDFTVASDLPDTLMPGAQVAVDMVFEPTETGDRTAEIVIPSTAGSYRFVVSGAALTELDIEASPGSTVYENDGFDLDSDNVVALALAEPLAHPVNLLLSLRSIEATAADDVQLPLNTFQLNVGQTRFEVPVDVVDDLIEEPREAFGIDVDASTSQGVRRVGDAEAAIAMSDGPQTLSFSRSRPNSISEGDPRGRSFDIIRTGPNTTLNEVTVTLTISGEAQLGTDFKAYRVERFDDGSDPQRTEFTAVSELTFSPGQTAIEVMVVAIDDRFDEAWSEPVFMELSSPISEALPGTPPLDVEIDGVVNPHHFSVLDNDLAEVTVATPDAVISEGQSNGARIRLARTGELNNILDITYGTRFTTSPDDLTLHSNGLTLGRSGDLRFEEGQAYIDIWFSAPDDNERERTEYLDFLLNDAGARFGYTTNTSSTRIQVFDNDYSTPLTGLSFVEGQPTASDHDGDGLSDTLEDSLLQALAPTIIPDQTLHHPIMSVEWYLEHSKLQEYVDGHWRDVNSMRKPSIQEIAGYLEADAQLHPLSGGQSLSGGRNPNYRFELDEGRFSRGDDPQDPWTEARTREEGAIYGRVSVPDDADHGAMYPEDVVIMQYYWFHAYNETAVTGGFGNHDGDWISVDYTVDITNASSPVIMEAIYHNHGRQFIYSPDDLTYDQGHPVVYQEKGTHEVHAHPGGTGLNVDLEFFPNLQVYFKEGGYLFGQYNFIAEDVIVREHRGGGTPYQSWKAPIVNLGEAETTEINGQRNPYLSDEVYVVMSLDGQVGRNKAGQFGTDGPRMPRFNGDKMWYRDCWVPCEV